MEWKSKNVQHLWGNPFCHVEQSIWAPGTPPRPNYYLHPVEWNKTSAGKVILTIWKNLWKTYIWQGLPSKVKGPVCFCFLYSFITDWIQSSNNYFEKFFGPIEKSMDQPDRTWKFINSFYSFLMFIAKQSNRFAITRHSHNHFKNWSFFSWIKKLIL